MATVLKKSTRVNYILSTWSGQRWGLPFDDGYLIYHLQQLKKVKHKLDQITIGRPENPSEGGKYKYYIDNLERIGHLNGTPVIVMDCPNRGRSYGQWSRMFERFMDNFSHYIFIEDDYAPVMDNFDEILVGLYEDHFIKDKCGFLCGMVDGKGRYFDDPAFCQHAAVSNGISRYCVLKDVYERFGCLPHDQHDYCAGQLIFSDAFVDVGYTLQDWLDKYRSLYWASGEDGIRTYGNPDLPDIFVPIQYLSQTSTSRTPKSIVSSSGSPPEPLTNREILPDSDHQSHKSHEASA